MTFKGRFWHPAALAFSGINLVGVGMAAGAAEPLHAGIHAVLALAAWSWAQRVRRPRPEVGGELPRVDALELEVNQVRRELVDVQERLDFTERMLAQAAESRRLEER